MFYCPNCNNTADIARASTIHQEGGFIYYNSDTSDISDSSIITNSTSSMTLTSSSVPTSISSIPAPSIIQENEGSDNNLSDIQLEHSSSQSGGDVSDIINKILDKVPIDETMTKNIAISDVTKHQIYKKLSPKKKEFVYNKIQDMLPVEKKKIMIEKPLKPEKENLAYFVCSNCGPLKRIEPGTLIYSKKSDALSQNYSTGNYDNMLYSNVLLHTRRYICPNDKCISHKDKSKRDAVVFRKNNSYEVKYICVACKTSF